MNRVMVVDAEGDQIIAIRRSNLTERQKRRLAVLDNRAAELGEWDSGVLADFLSDDEDILKGVFLDTQIAAIATQHHRDLTEAILGVDQDEDEDGEDGEPKERTDRPTQMPTPVLGERPEDSIYVLVVTCSDPRQQVLLAEELSSRGLKVVPRKDRR